MHIARLLNTDSPSSIDDPHCSQDQDVTVATAVEAPSPDPHPPPTSFPMDLLPPELRLMIWSRAVEPRIVLFNELIQAPQSYAMPVVTQINGEARAETHQGYERTGMGSYLHFSRDIVVCDFTVADMSSDSVLETMATSLERVTFWDCAPDDVRVEVPQEYSRYLSRFYRPKYKGKIDLDRFWFPNLHELWIIKVGDVDASWKVNFDRTASYSDRLRQQAREFRYWVDSGIIEMAQLEPSEADASAILREGRCHVKSCHKLNEGRNKIISKVNFMDGKYREPTDGRAWVRINPTMVTSSRGSGNRAVVNALRWALVERTLTFSLHWEDMDDTGAARIRRHQW